MHQEAVVILHIHVVSIFMMLRELVNSSWWQYIFPNKGLIADVAVRLVLLNHTPEEVLEPLLFLRQFDAHTASTLRILICLATVTLTSYN